MPAGKKGKSTGKSSTVVESEAIAVNECLDEDKMLAIPEEEAEFPQSES